jgi:hypothetical protein
MGMRNQTHRLHRSGGTSLPALEMEEGPWQPSTPHRGATPPEVKQRAVQLVLKTRKQNGERHGVVSAIARQLDVGSETLRHWVR